MVAGLASAQTPMMYEQEALNRLNSKMFAKTLDGKSSDYPSDFSKNTLAFDLWHYARVVFKDGSEMDSLRMNFDFNIDALVVQFNLDISAISLDSDQVRSFNYTVEGKKKEYIKIPESAFGNIDYEMPFFLQLAGGDGDQMSMV